MKELTVEEFPFNRFVVDMNQGDGLVHIDDEAIKREFLDSQFFPGSIVPPKDEWSLLEKDKDADCTAMVLRDFEKKRILRRAAQSAKQLTGLPLAPDSIVQQISNS